MLVIDEIFEMRGGYVLNFSDRTFGIFFTEELNIDIDNPTYSRYGTSKAKRLRCFLQTVDKPMAVRTLKALWEYREALRERSGQEDRLLNSYSRLLTVIDRLNLDPLTGEALRVPSATPFDRAVYAILLRELQDLSALDPQPRGYAFESFLKRLFDKFGLEAREPFRLRGEQIDGSFILENEIYLLEAK